MTFFVRSTLQSCCLALSAALPLVSVPDAAPGERDALRSLDEPALEEQRASHAPALTLDDSERSGLRELQQDSGDLEAQRAGDISNETLTTILLVLGIVLLLLIIF